MVKKLIFVLMFLGGKLAFATETNIIPAEKEGNEKTVDVNSFYINDSTELMFVDNFQLFEQGWNQLAHPLFWKKIIKLSADSCLINIGETREIIEVKSVKEWEAQSKEEKETYRDSIRTEYGLDKSARIFVTTGKKDFYLLDNILPEISRGVEIFKNQEVDPWYAQAILMIESPGRLAKSHVGAYGAFQLMPDVARKFGLKVNRTVDEREDFDKSAVAAGQLIQTVCVPYAEKILKEHCVDYQTNDLWFRLFVLHVYHAGAYNVAGVVNKIAPEMDGKDLIQQMWITENGSFRNASQNYSQLALAAMMILDDLIQKVEYLCQND